MSDLKDLQRPMSEIPSESLGSFSFEHIMVLHESWRGPKE